MRNYVDGRQGLMIQMPFSGVSTVLDRLLLAAVAVALVTTPALAKSKSKPAAVEQVACEGAFAIDSSEARLIEIYGAGTVWTGIVPGPEGIDMLATEVFRDDPQKKLQFVWWNEKQRVDPSYIELPPTLASPGGVRAGLTVDEVAAINGEEFTLSGFGWDYGGFASIQSGTLSGLPGGCMLSIHFGPSRNTHLDTMPITGDVTVSSDEPLLDAVGAKVEWVSVGYPHYDFRD